MIDLYTWGTPNGHKVSIMLEEIRLPFKTIPIDIRKGAQFAPEFLKISPNNKIPAIVDPDGPSGKPIALFESGAILLYLAEKSDQLLPMAARARFAVIEWLVFQVANVGPMFGQAGHFTAYAPEKIPYAIERYTNEVRRECAVMDKRLGETEYLGGSEYSIADIATFPWVTILPGRDPNAFDTFPNLKRWVDAIAKRPAVQRGLKVPTDAPAPPMDDKAREILFGKKQYERR